MSNENNHNHNDDKMNDWMDLVGLNESGEPNLNKQMNVEDEDVTQMASLMEAVGLNTGDNNQKNEMSHDDNHSEQSMMESQEDNDVYSLDDFLQSELWEQHVPEQTLNESSNQLLEDAQEAAYAAHKNGDIGTDSLKVILDDIESMS